MQTMTRRGIEWLSAAASDPVTCRMRWEDDPRRPLMLPAGQLFDVVSVEQRLGLEAFDQLNRHDLPSGPVMIDHRARRVGFFLSANSRYWFAYFIKREAKRPVDYRYLSSDSVVVVPGPMPLSGDRYEWLRAPIRRPEANPCRPIALATVLGASAELLARVDRYGEKFGSPDDAVAAYPEEPVPGA